MNSKLRSVLVSRVLAAALLLGSPSFSNQSNAQPASVRPDARRIYPALPLEQSAARGIVTRDPSSVVKCNDEYWVFYTGRGVPTCRSKDLVRWEHGPAVFEKAPDWVAKAVPANRNMSYWAPDIMNVGNRYLLYYSVSTIGKMTSAIGLATTPTLDPSDPAFHWTDEGIVVQTQEGQPGEAYNAIDPAIFQDTDGSLWLVFGSYWTGIKLVQLDPKTGKRIAPDSKIHSLAYNESIEASYLCKRDDYYYLFVNWGSCCQGTNSTYNIRIGRSKVVTGPYLDKAGVNMQHNGGSVFIAATNNPLFGPGHASTLNAQGKEWFTSDFEGDVRMEGKATLAIMPLHWNADGWPEVTIHELTSAAAKESPVKK
ncbi:MAG: arabinan endo-1,5-alpha-L-arabinosidase [Verrucomicrobiota bacterium]